MSKARELSKLLSGTLKVGALQAPAGTTAQRPTPANGMIRYNSELKANEVYADGAWGTIAPPPTIVSTSPSTYNGEQGTQFTITGNNFTPDAIVKFITNTGVEFSAGSSSYLSRTTLTATTPQDFTVAQEPLSVKVIQGSGSYTINSVIDCGGVPSWNTAAGTIGTCYDAMRSGYYVDVSAGDPDLNATLSYSLASGSLPIGMSLNASTGRISGTPSAVSADTTYNFTLSATDNAGNSTQRSFSIVIKAPIIVPYTTAGAFTLSLPASAFEVLSVGAGGGAGGSDGSTAGNAGASGGAVYAKYAFSSPQTLSIYVGGGGQSGFDECNGAASAGSTWGAGGYNGGGDGGRAGTSPCSGSGAGGGGWSGIYIGSTPYVVAGGGAGGGGANEGDANDLAPFGGGYQPNGANGTSTTGGTGTNYSGDGGGYGGGGGGYYGGIGSTGGRSANGGAHHVNASNRVDFVFANGNNGPVGPNTTGASAITAPNASLFGYSNNAGKGANGATGGGSRGETGGTGAVYIRY